MSTYRAAFPFSVPMEVLTPTETKAKGAVKKTYPAAGEGFRINGSFKTYGGTERESNGVYTTEDTATIETWYRPDITAKCRVILLETGGVYEIEGEPEDIERRHQFLVFKVRRVKGGA